MEETMDIVISATDNTSDTFQSVSEAAEQMGSSMQEGAEAGTQGFEEVEDAAEGAEDPISQISSILEGFVGVEVFTQLADALWDMADKAGTFEDSLMRARLEAEGAGIDVNAMTDAVTELSTTTGRAGSEIRESFITATSRGITDLGSFKSMMEGAGAQATLFGTDIQSMADKFSTMAMRSTLMERSLASTGITMDELAEAMGMAGATADEVKDKWKELDTNQKAALLGQAAAMNEGQTANEEYKKSWAGLQARIEIAKGRILRLAGEVLLPVLIPALEIAARVLNWFGDTISAVMDGPLGGLISVVGASAAAFALAVPAYMAITGAISLIETAAIPAATALWGMVAPLLPFIALGAAVAFVVFEIGKAFGWWTDVSSMLDAIWAGVQRLWSAFINHPDVQSFLYILSQAWNVLSGAVGTAISWVLSFFNINTSGEFDIIRALIVGIGIAWNAITAPIRLVIAVVKLLWSTVNTAGAKIQATVGRIRTYFVELPGKIKGAIASLVNIITAPFSDAYTGVKDAIDDIKNYVSGIPKAVSDALSGLANTITKPFSDAYDTIKGVVDDIKSKAREIPVIGGYFGGEDLPLSGGNAFGGEDLSLNSTTYTNGTLKVTNDVNLTLDLRNVPSSIDETTLKNALMDGLTSKEVLNILVNNNDFQTLDKRAKDRIMMRNNRARGV